VQQRSRRQPASALQPTDSVSIASTPILQTGPAVAAMEATVTALLELLDGGSGSNEQRSAALRRIRAARTIGQSDTSAVSDRAVQRLLAHVHVRYDPAEDEPSVLTDRLLTATAAAEAVGELLLHPHYAASAALRTRESVYALFDVLVAADRHAMAEKTAGTVASCRLAHALTDGITAAAASISECPPRSPDDPARAGWPPADLYCDGLLRPGVITSLLGVGWRWESRQSDPVSATRFWLQQLIRNRQPEAGSAPLNLPVPASCHETDNPKNWAMMIDTSLVWRLLHLPLAAQLAPFVSELIAWLNMVLELHSVFGNNVLQVIATSSTLCDALMMHITRPALPLELRQHAGAVIHLLMMKGPSDRWFSNHAIHKREARPFLSSLLQLVAMDRGRSSGSGSGSGDSQGGAGHQAAALATAAQAAAEMAAHLLVVIAGQDLADMRPSRIAAQRGAAASIVGGLRACLRQLAPSSSRSTPSHIRAHSLTALASLTYLAGSVALDDGERGGSAWAAFMLQLAPLREVITLITSGGPITGEAPATFLNRVAFGLYSIAAKHAEVFLQQQQSNGSPQQVGEQAALLNDCMETATRVLASTGEGGAEAAILLGWHLPSHRTQLARVGGMLCHMVRKATSGDVRHTAEGVQSLYLVAAKWLEQQHQAGQVPQLLPRPDFVNSACPSSACDGHTGSDWFTCPYACEAPDVPCAIKAAEVPLRVLAGAAATDPELAAQAELALEALQGCRAQVEQQQTQQEAAVESAAQLMQAALSLQDEVQCAACSKTAADGVKLQRCIGCRAVWFCSLECQRADWRSPTGHKAACKAAQQLRQQQQAAAPSGAEDVAA